MPKSTKNVADLSLPSKSEPYYILSNCFYLTFRYDETHFFSGSRFYFMYFSYFHLKIFQIMYFDNVFSSPSFPQILQGIQFLKLC